MSIVKNKFNIFKKFCDGEHFSEELRPAIIEAAKQSKEEFQELLNLFHEEANHMFKVDLAEILAELQYKPIIPFFFIINCIIFYYSYPLAITCGFIL